MVFQQALIKSLREHGERTAIETDEERITYAELQRRADLITRFLVHEGIGKETLIGILMNDRVDMICSIIGIANARCVFVPIDGSLPHLRIVSMINNLNLSHVISSGDSLPMSSSKQYSLKDIFANDSSAFPAAEYPEYDESDALYIYFTSGSTGIPKGIVGRNRSLLQFIQWETSTFHFNTSTRVSQLISPYFDAFLRDIFAPLLSGGAVCIPPQDDDLYSPSRIISWIDETRISLIHCVPSVFGFINNDLLSPDRFAALQYVLLSGERIIPVELKSWYSIFGDRIQLVNLYGPTETTMVRCSYMIRPADVRSKRIPVGAPVSDTEIIIFDKDLRPCPSLVSGEVCIVTNYASKGYLNDPELTHEKFLRVNSGADSETITFKTGDIGRVLANGQIDLLGREDRQIKMQGVRIEPGEIESVFIESGYLDNVAVLPHSENGSESLVAFVVMKEEIPPNMDVESALANYVGQRLPRYMIPGQIKGVKKFPLLSNGKIDHRQLLGELEAKSIVAPENDVEAKMLDIWKQVIADEFISTEDSFTRVGGNSLAILRLIALIHKEFNIRLSLQDVFENMTIRKQAQLISTQLIKNKALV